MWKIHSPHGDQQRKQCRPRRVTPVLPCDGPGCSIADNLLSSTATYCPPPLPPSHVCYTRKTSPAKQRLRVSPLLTCARLNKKKQKKKKNQRERCSPTQPPPLHLWKCPAHSLASHQSTSQLLPFEYEGPSKRKRHLARAFQQLNRSLYGSVLKMRLTLWETKSKEVT